MATYRLIASGTFLSGRTWSTRQHVTSAAPLATVLAQLTAVWTDAWTNVTYGLQTLYPAGTSLTEVAVAELTPLFREANKVNQPLALIGTSVADSLPEQDTILVSLRGTSVAANSRGRMSLPAPATDAAVGGELTAPSAVRAATAIRQLFSSLRADGATFFVYNTKVSAHDPVLFTEKVILTEEVDRVIRTQRRRSRKSRAVYV